MPPAVAAGVTAAATAASAGASIAAASQGDPGPTRFKFDSPELEFDFLNRVGPLLEAIDSDIERSVALESALNDKITIERERISGALPSQDSIERLRQANERIAQAFGGRTEEAIRQGFLTEQDRTELEELKSLEGIEGTDPRIEAQISDNRQNLRDQLRRELGPGYETTEAGRRAIDEFERNAEQLRFSTRQELIGQTTGRAAQRAEIRLASRQQGLAEAVAGQESIANALRGEREALLVGSQELTRLTGTEFEAGQGGIQTRRGLRGDTTDLFKGLAQLDLSKQGKQALESGLVGPGSLFTQSGGIAREDFGRFAKTQRQFEKLPSRSLIAALQGGNFVRGNDNAGRRSPLFPFGSPSDFVRRRRGSSTRTGGLV